MSHHKAELIPNWWSNAHWNPPETPNGSKSSDVAEPASSSQPQTHQIPSNNQALQLSKYRHVMIPPATRKGIRIFGNFIEGRPKSTSSFAQLFRRLPVEIRLKIFRYTFLGAWDGKAPPLIQALCTKETLKYYFEAVDVFPEVNTYWLHSGNDWSFFGRGQYQISGLRHLALEMENIRNGPKHSTEAHYNMIGDIWLSSATARLTTLHISAEEFTTIQEPITESEILNADYIMIRTIMLLRGITMYCRRLEVVTATTSNNRGPLLFFICNMNHRFNTTGRLMHVTTGTKLIWFWDLSSVAAPKGWFGQASMFCLRQRELEPLPHFRRINGATKRKRY